MSCNPILDFYFGTKWFNEQLVLERQGQRKEGKITRVFYKCSIVHTPKDKDVTSVDIHETVFLHGGEDEEMTKMLDDHGFDPFQDNARLFANREECKNAAVKHGLHDASYLFDVVEAGPNVFYEHLFAIHY